MIEKVLRGSMAKDKKIFFCKECGYESSKWQGQCPGCGEWNTFVEQEVKVQRGTRALSGTCGGRPKPTSIKKGFFCSGDKDKDKYR